MKRALPLSLLAICLAVQAGQSQTSEQATADGPEISVMEVAPEAYDSFCSYWLLGDELASGSENWSFYFLDRYDGSVDQPINTGAMLIDGEVRDLIGLSEHDDGIRIETNYRSSDGLYEVSLVRIPDRKTPQGEYQEYTKYDVLVAVEGARGTTALVLRGGCGV